MQNRSHMISTSGLVKIPVKMKPVQLLTRLSNWTIVNYYFVRPEFWMLTTLYFQISSRSPWGTSPIQRSSRARIPSVLILFPPLHHSSRWCSDRIPPRIGFSSIEHLEAVQDFSHPNFKRTSEPRHQRSTCLHRQSCRRKCIRP
jgi:hypothetical protein